MVSITREELFEKVWREPSTIVARRLLISDVMLGKLCRKLQVPKPPPGYWAKKKAGVPTPLAWLPPFQMVEKPKRKVREAPKVDVPKEKLWNEDSLPPRATLHPLVLKTREALLGGNLPLDRHGKAMWTGCLDARVSEFVANRAMQFWNKLIFAIEARGFSVTLKEDGTGVNLRGERIGISMRERSRRTHSIPPSEASYCHWTHFYERTGKLILTIDSPYDKQLRVTWAEGRATTLDQWVPDIIEALIVAAKLSAEATKRWMIQVRKEAEKKRIRQIETDKRDKLKSDVADWEESQRIKRYLAGLERSKLKGTRNVGSHRRWLKWAQSYADSIDPIVRVKP